LNNNNQSSLGSTTKKLSAAAVMSGKLKIDGSYELLQQFQQFFPK
jgi:hypothetical protein